MSGATFVMVVRDRLSKSCIFSAMKEMIVEGMEDALMRCLIQHNGSPSAIVSNRGRPSIWLLDVEMNLFINEDY